MTGLFESDNIKLVMDYAGGKDVTPICEPPAFLLSTLSSEVQLFCGYICKRFYFGIVSFDGMVIVFVVRRQNQFRGFQLKHQCQFTLERYLKQVGNAN